MDPDGILHSVFNFENYGELLALVQNSLWAAPCLTCSAAWWAPSL